MAKQSALATLIMGVCATAQAIELTDYIDPNSSFDDAYIYGTANFADGDSQERASHNVNLSADYDYRFNTLPRSYYFNIDGRVTMNKSASEAEGQTTNINFGVDGGVDNYFNGAYPKAFWFASGALGYDNNEVEKPGSESETTTESARLTAGLGYGRVFNATPLAKVLRIEEELRKYGVLTGPVADDVYLELAKIVDREDEYKSRHGNDEYKPFWVADMEEVLKRAGVLNGGQLGALGTLKINDILFEESISNRRHGWLVRLGASWKANDISGLTSEVSESDPALLLEAEYAQPLGLRAQFINVATFEPAESVTTFKNDMSYTYEVSDRLDWLNSWGLSYTNSDTDTATPTTVETVMKNTFTSTWAYEVSSDLDYTVGLSFTNTDSEQVNGASTDASDTQLNMGVTYRLK